MKLIQKLSLIAVIISPLSAFADLTICNNYSESSISIATGVHKNRKIETRGWFNIDSKKCSKVIVGDLTKLDSNLVYILGESFDGNSVWGGNKTLCVKNPGPFTFTDGEGACNSGRKTNFRTLTVDDKKDYTVSLSLVEDEEVIEFIESNSDNQKIEISSYLGE